MTMAANRVAELCGLTAGELSEDLQLMEQGIIKIEMFGMDMTKELVERLRANLHRMQQVIDGCTSDSAVQPLDS